MSMVQHGPTLFLACENSTNEIMLDPPSPPPFRFSVFTHRRNAGIDHLTEPIASFELCLAVPNVQAFANATSSFLIQQDSHCFDYLKTVLRMGLILCHILSLGERLCLIRGRERHGKGC